MKLLLPEAWMRRCLELAETADQSGEAPVGAIIARGDDMVVEATEHVNASMDIGEHAELIAIRQACRALGTLDLSGCTLYTNVEPCWMCSFAIRQSGISEVVIGEAVPDIGGATSRYPILSDPDIPGWRPPPNIIWLEMEYRMLRNGS